MSRLAGPGALLGTALVAGVLVACAVAYRLGPLGGERSRPACARDDLLRSSCGPLVGAYVRPAPGRTTTEAVRGFERRSGRRLDLVHVYARGDDAFPTSEQLALLHRSGRTLLVNWKPDLGHTWAAVAAGAADERIDRAAARLRVRLGGRRFFLALHHEPEDEVRPAGTGYTARDYAAMYRHVVQRLREDGVHGAVTVMNYMGFHRWAGEPWFADLYPGDDVVDWIAFDLYATAGLGGQRGGFRELVDPRRPQAGWRGPYDWATAHHPGKPLMLAEWGVGERPGRPRWKARFFATVPGALERLPRVRALVYFSDYDAPKAGDTRPGTTPSSATAFRSMVEDIAPAVPPHHLRSAS